MAYADMGAGRDVRVQSGDVIVHGRGSETEMPSRRGDLVRWHILSPEGSWTMMSSQTRMIEQNIDQSD